MSLLKKDRTLLGSVREYQAARPGLLADPSLPARGTGKYLMEEEQDATVSERLGNVSCCGRCESGATRSDGSDVG